MNKQNRHALIDSKTGLVRNIIIWEGLKSPYAEICNRSSTTKRPGSQTTKLRKK